MTRSRWRIAIVVGLLIVGCSSDGGDERGDDASGDATPTVVATPTTRVPAAASPADRAVALCASTAEPVTRIVSTGLVVEASGVAASRTDPGVIWAHNDSGDTARVVAIAADGEPRGVYLLGGAEAIDWEDMALGPGPLGITDHLYLGDIGDNAAARSEVVVYRIAEPGLDVSRESTLLEGAERIVLRYPDGAHDAETLLVDPVTRDLIIVTKEIIAGDSGVYRVDGSAVDAGGGTLERAGTVTKATLTSARTPPDDTSALVRGVGWLPTGGDISSDGALIVIRTYASVFIWARDEGETVAEALAGTPCEAPSAYEAQGEAIAFTPDGDGYYTVSEGANPTLYRFSVD